MTRRTALAALAGVPLAACRSAPSGLRRLRVVSAPRFTVAPLQLADERGYLRDAGLNLELQLIANPTQLIPLLAGGTADIAFAAAAPAAFNAIAKGALIRIVAARDIAVAGCTHEMHGRRASFPAGFQSAAELRGKRVAVNAETSLTAFLLDALLSIAGLDSGAVERVVMPVADSIQALVAGKMDAVVDLDRTFNGPDIVAGPGLATWMPGLQYGHVFFGSTLLDADARIGAAFLAAYFRGVREFRAGETPAMLERLAAGSGMDVAAIRTACRDRLSTDGRVDPASVQRMIEWAARKQFIPESMEASRIIDTRFLEQG